MRRGDDPVTRGIGHEVADGQTSDGVRLANPFEIGSSSG
jgi:hypothetical protein